MTKLIRATNQGIAISETNRVVATAMADGAGFNTGAETWLVGRHRKPSPNRAAIRHMKRRAHGWFKKHGKTNPDVAMMGARIAACGQRRLHHRCLHPACPRCAHALQRLLVRVVRRYHAGQPEEAWATISIVLPPHDPSADPDFVSEGIRYRALLEAAGITRGVFALDLSFNEDRRPLSADQRFADHACVHLYGLAPVVEMAAVKRMLKQLTPVSNAVPRPVKVRPWDGSPTAIAYVHKPGFSRRQTILVFNEQRKKLVRDTRDKPLINAQQIHAVRALDRAGLAGRLILLGLHFEATETGQFRLVATN